MATGMIRSLQKAQFGFSLARPYYGIPRSRQLLHRGRQQRNGVHWIGKDPDRSPYEILILAPGMCMLPSFKGLPTGQDMFRRSILPVFYLEILSDGDRTI
jgi:hypothetical protein